MKRYYFGILALVVTNLSLGQTSENYIFNKNEVIIPKNISVAQDVFVFKGEIPEDRIAVSTRILGKIQENQNTLSFTPVVPFGWNQKYTVVYNHTINYFSLPVPEGYESLKILKVYPSTSNIPSNILKWYVKFSRPINENNIYKYIQFVDDSNKPIDRTILPLQNALISKDGTLLTIWIEPGRQKRNLIPNKQLGSVFIPQKKYRLVISEEIKDHNGVNMVKNFSKEFTTTVADRKKPNINNWEIKIPNIHSVSNLLINCEKPIDYGSSIGNIKILDSAGQLIDGIWELKKDETVVSFIPKRNWKKGNYTIIFGSSIEDLAGNNLNHVFDNEIQKTSKNNHPYKTYTLEFELK
ncbi:Ig-like domain-containing protein [Aquimarina sp. LLG6339-5]|uniref:Ig-like domain-containing protein n=1 Tax=Aquimarina sp. LLG6339-5 TaxID=3160830 RepID=UPI00386C6044